MAYEMSHSIVIDGKRTSMRMEPQLWAALGEVAEYKGMTKNELCTKIAVAKETDMGLTSAIRVFLILFYRKIAKPVMEEEADG